MSIASYQRNVARRVTGPALPTCFPSALEQISPHHSYRAQIYRGYRDFVDWYCSLSIPQRAEQNAEYAAMIDGLVKPLGDLACEDLVFKRANTSLGMIRIVKALLNSDFRVTVDLRYRVHSGYNIHTVGLLPTAEADYVTLVSTHVPQALQGVVSLQKVADHLAQPAAERFNPAYPFSNANITALPPVD